MRWVPPRAGDLALDGRLAGVHKVAGTTVEAVVGGVLHQFVRGVFLNLVSEADWTMDREGVSLIGFSIRVCFHIYYYRAHHSGYRTFYMPTR